MSEQPSNETVKIRVVIEISSADTHDTGLSIAEWNALTADERSEIAQQLWEIEAQRDNGGKWVETDGAASL